MGSKPVKNPFNPLTFIKICNTILCPNTILFRPLNRKEDELHLVSVFFLHLFFPHMKQECPRPLLLLQLAKAYCVALQQSRAEMIGRQTAGSMQSSSMFKLF